MRHRVKNILQKPLADRIVEDMTHKNDREVLEEIGDETLLASGVPLHCVKQWKYRAIPWKDRGRVARLAATKRVKLPPDFIENQRPAV